ncbi:hypothetical protein JD969_00990 [Planctomycetota bacterium]|nr:hypothetical protein JD969_00990 [Planctomycetota bacterium]
MKYFVSTYIVNLILVLIFTCMSVSPTNGMLKKDLGNYKHNTNNANESNKPKFTKIKPRITSDDGQLRDISITIECPPRDKSKGYYYYSLKELKKIDVQADRDYRVIITGTIDREYFCYYQTIKGKNLDDIKVHRKKMIEKEVRFYEDTPNYPRLKVRVYAGKSFTSSIIKPDETFRFLANRRYVKIGYVFGLTDSSRIYATYRDADMLDHKPVYLGGPLKGHIWEQSLVASQQRKAKKKLQLHFLTDRSGTVMSLSYSDNQIKRLSDHLERFAKDKAAFDQLRESIKPLFKKMSYRKSKLIKVKTEHFSIHVPEEMKYIADWYLWQFEEAFSFAEQAKLKHPPKFIELRLHLHSGSVGYIAKGGRKNAGISMPLDGFLICNGYIGYVSDSADALLRVFDGRNTKHYPGLIDCPCLRKLTKQSRDVSYIPDPMR